MTVTPEPEAKMLYLGTLCLSCLGLTGECCAPEGNQRQGSQSYIFRQKPEALFHNGQCRPIGGRRLLPNRHLCPACISAMCVSKILASATRRIVVAPWILHVKLTFSSDRMVMTARKMEVMTVSTVGGHVEVLDWSEDRVLFKGGMVGDERVCGVIEISLG